MSVVYCAPVVRNRDWSLDPDGGVIAVNAIAHPINPSSCHLLWRVTSVRRSVVGVRIEMVMIGEGRTATQMPLERFNRSYRIL